MSKSSWQVRTLASALAATAALSAAPAANAAGPLTLTSRVDSTRDYIGVIGSRVAVADFNGDGIDDHAVTSTNLVTVFFGGPGAADGRGTLKLTASFTNAINPGVSAAGDVDGDGFDDLVITPSIGATRAILVYGATANPASLALNAASARITNITIGAWGPQAQTAMGVGDFNGDGKDDLIVPSKSGANPTAGTSSVAIVSGGPRVATINGVAAGPRVSVLLGYRTCKNVFSIFVPGFYRQECQTPEPVVAPVGDFNGDGKTDLYVDGRSNAFPSIVLGRVGSGAVINAVAPGTGSTSLSAVQAKYGSSYGGPAIRLGDVDGDQLADFSLPVNAGLGGGAAVIRGRANPAATLPAAGSTLRLPSGTILGVAGDQTGDGRADLLTTQSTGLAVASLSAGSSAFSLTPVVGTPNGGGSPSDSVGDLDGDGAIDLLLANETAAFRFTHSGAPVKPRLEVSTVITTAVSGFDTAVTQTLTTTCQSNAQTRTGWSNDTISYGLDGSLSIGDRCTVKTTQALPTSKPFDDCTWSTTATFRGEAVDPGAAFTIGADPNQWRQTFTCTKPEVVPEPTDFPATFDGWQQSGAAAGAGAVLKLTTGPNQTSSAVWPKPVNMAGKVFTFTVTMGGGNGAAEGLTLSFLSNVGGQPSGLLGAGGGQLGFGGLSGSAIAFDAFKQPEDAQANTVSFVDGTNGTSLRKLYTKDAGVNMRGKAITWTVSGLTGGRISITNDRGISHVVNATLPDSVFLAFTGSTSAIWQNQTVAGLRWEQ